MKLSALFISLIAALLIMSACTSAVAVKTTPASSTVVTADAEETNTPQENTIAPVTQNTPELTPSETDGDEFHVWLWDFFNVDYFTSLLCVKPVKSLGEFYFYDHFGESLVVEVLVEKDYYDHMKKGDVINMVIPLNNHVFDEHYTASYEYIDATELEKCIMACDTIIYYTPYFYSSDNNIWKTKDCDGARIRLTNLTGPRLDAGELIPFVNSEIDFELFDAIYNEKGVSLSLAKHFRSIAHHWEYSIKQGDSFETVDSLVCELVEKKIYGGVFDEDYNPVYTFTPPSCDLDEDADI